MSPEEIEALALSMQVAALAVLLVLGPALAVAWALARVPFRGKPIAEGLVMLPLVLPPVVTGYGLLLLFGRNGIIGRALESSLGISFAFEWTGAALASAVVAFPLAVRSIRLSIESIDPRLEMVARTLGASPARRLWTVTLPLALPGILNGAILAFARSLGEFGATITFVGSIPGHTRTLPLAIYSALERPNAEEMATRLVLISILLSVLAIAASESIARGAKT